MQIKKNRCSDCSDLIERDALGKAESERQARMHQDFLVPCKGDYSYRATAAATAAAADCSCGYEYEDMFR